MENKSIKDTINSILDAVEIVLEQEKGLSFSIDQVAKVAKLSKGGVLYHFPNKAGLLIGLVDRFILLFDLAVEDLMKRKGLSYREAYVEVSFSSNSVKSVRAMIAVAVVDEALLKNMGQAYKIWDTKLEKDCGSKDLALSVRLMVDGYLLTSAGNFSHVPLIRVKAAILSLK
jgi:AcrR family transcriptional regulator